MSQGRLLRIRDVAADLGVSERTINRLHSAGKFPPKVQISTNTTGWREADIERWKAEREPVQRFA
jgi:predicted DNA-binding transcriptional regulator AlpA